MGAKFEKRFRAFASFVLSRLTRVKFGTRRFVGELPKEGSLILCNHTSIWDFANLCYALRPYTNVHFVATGIEFDKSRFHNWLMSSLGIIRKNQGAVDVMCVKEIIKAVRAGDSVALYAAGMTSFDGREAWDIMSGTGNLARLLKCPVYVAVSEGGFISHPRFAHRSFRGKVDITFKRVCTGENLSADDYQNEINTALRFNDWDWQEKNRIPFRGMNDMTGITNLLYMCPECGALGKMSAEKGKITCGCCGFTAKRDKYGFFSSESKKCPARMDKWCDMELNEVRALVDGGRLDFSEKAVYETAEGDKPGTLMLTNSGVSFESETEKLEWSFRDFLFFVLDDVNHLSFNQGGERRIFRFENPALIYRWFFAHRCIADPAYRRG